MPAVDDKAQLHPQVSAGATRVSTESAGDRLRTDALAANIATRLGMCSHDELRVVDVILGRLEKGRDDYGYLELDGDPRNWRDEAAEELVDLAIYDACDRIARRDEHLARLRCEAADELAAKVGDDHTLETCRNKFSNFIPYGNAPDPRDNPFCDHEPVTSPHERFDHSEGG